MGLYIILHVESNHKFSLYSYMKTSGVLLSHSQIYFYPICNLLLVSDQVTFVSSGIVSALFSLLLDLVDLMVPITSIVHEQDHHMA